MGRGVVVDVRSTGGIDPFVSMIRRCYHPYREQTLRALDSPHRRLPRSTEKHHQTRVSLGLSGSCHLAQRAPALIDELRAAVRTYP
jgi:hypothetical protein